jgi:hypothetical protein
MDNKRPYTHILKNLFHEQAAEIIPLLMPGYRVEQVLMVEMPELESTYIEGSPDPVAEGLTNLALPGTKVLGVYETEWIEHSGKFERAYCVHNPTAEKSRYLVIEFQTEREDEDLSLRLLSNFVRVNRFVREDLWQEDDEDDETEQDDNDAEQKHKGTTRITHVYPVALSPLPQAAPAPIRDTSDEQPSLSFNFKVLGLWEIDAREMLNTHVSAIYFLLPAMKNVDATLLGLAIEELALRFQHDETELGRHLSGFHLMLQQSEIMPEEEKVAALKHLKRFTHLIKDDPYDD